ncbi:MAG: hypothetical protein AB9866_15000 [Syntrophobacteraceae bacterium]
MPVKVVVWLGQAHKGTKCGIHVGKDTKYQTLKDLKGARIATSGNLMPKTMLTHAAHLGGLELKDLRPIYGGRTNSRYRFFRKSRRRFFAPVMTPGSPPAGHSTISLHPAIISLRSQWWAWVVPSCSSI